MSKIPQARWLLVLLLLFGSAGAFVWYRAHTAGVIATLASATRDVTRDYRGSEQRWVAAQIGDGMRMGDAVRTGLGAHAVLSLRDGASMVLDPDTVVRFLERAPERGEFRVESGLAALQTGNVGVQIETALGLFSLAPHTTVRLQHQAAGTHLRVDMGKASLIDPSQAPHAISPGDEMFLKGGQPPRLLHKSNQPEPGQPLPASAPLLASTTVVDVELDSAAELEREMNRKLALPPQPSRADVMVRAGEQATVHDPGVATHVRLDYERVCPKGAGIVDVATLRGKLKPRAMSQHSAVIRVGAGVTRYRVRCADGPRGALRVVANGQIRMVRDAAMRRVPMRPPTNELDLDGRRYTVLYQNRLPAVVARAPSNMRAGRVVVRSGSRLRTLDAPGGAATFASGELTDGLHEVFFESLDGRTRSPVTRLAISFDNAAPMASFDQRGSVAPDDAGAVMLSGVVPLGSRVSLSGQALPLDPGGRFEVKAQPGESDAAVALRVEHPRAGLHYYVRRIEGAGDAP